MLREVTAAVDSHKPDVSPTLLFEAPELLSPPAKLRIILFLVVDV